MEISIDNNQPLLLIHYVWWRILWRLFIPYIPSAFMLYGFGDYFVKQGNPIAYITMYTLMLFCIGMAISLLLTRGFRFYSDYMEKSWFLFGTVSMEYNKIKAGLTYINMRIFNFREIAFEKKLKYFYLIIRLDRNLINRTTEQDVIQFLANISHKDILEFQDNVPFSLFFLPNEIPFSQSHS